MDVRLIGIDWQNDFCDPKGSLFVPGAVEEPKLIFVTNYARSSTSMAATNAQEMGTETAFMREIPAFKMYELFNKPYGLKEFIDSTIMAAMNK